jgi:serine/threonine-protein kinase
MGVVWEAIEERTGARRALKFIKDEERSVLAGRRLLREAGAASAIRHPNVVRIEEVAADDDGMPVIVMEFLEGESLGARLEREGTLSLGQTAAIVARVAAALRAAHAAGVIHRDLKPDNVFLAVEPSGVVDVRVLDFGIAKQYDLPIETLTVTGTLVGTPQYMSPEQAGGEQGVDARTDVWSIAVILFESLTGTTPVTGDNYGQLLTRLIRNDVLSLSSLRSDLPTEILSLVEGALVPRDRRPFDLAPMEAILARYANGELAMPRTVVQRQPSPPAETAGELLVGETVSVTWQPAPVEPHEPRGTRRFRIVAAVAGMLLLSAAAAATYAMRARARELPRQSPVSFASEGVPRADAAADDSVTTLTRPPVVAEAATAASATTSASAGSTTRRPSSPSRPGTPSSAASSKHGSTTPTRLQGGVAGDVPF